MTKENTIAGISYTTHYGPLREELQGEFLDLEFKSLMKRLALASRDESSRIVDTDAVLEIIHEAGKKQGKLLVLN